MPSPKDQHPISDSVPLFIWQGLTVAGLTVGASLRLGAPGATVDNVRLVNGLIIVTLCSPLLAMPIKDWPVVDYIPS